MVFVFVASTLNNVEKGLGVTVEVTEVKLCRTTGERSSVFCREAVVVGTGPAREKVS